MYSVFATIDGNRVQLHDGYPDSRLKCLGTGKQAVNSIDSLELSLYPDNPGYGLLVPNLTMIEVIRNSDKKLKFKGRVYKPTGEMNSNGLTLKKYVCEGELSYLWDSVQSYHTAHGALEMFTVMLADHNQQMPEDKKIYLGQVIAESEARQHTWHYVKTMQAIQDYIRDYGGEIRLRYGEDGKRYLDYTSTVWASGSDTKIELAVNMQSVSWTVDPASIASGVYAVGAKLHDDGSSAERLELHEVIWNADLVTKYGEIVAVVEWDDVTVEANLRRKAEEWLSTQSGELHQYSVQAVDLSKIDRNYDEFEVGVQYAVKNPLIGLDDVIRCIGKTWSINDITKDRLTFGDKYETLTALTSSRAKMLSDKIDKAAATITQTQEEFVRRVVRNQTELITGLKGGNKIEMFDSEGHPTDTIWMNTPSVETASFAVRINAAGIGFWRSTSGGSPLEGPYDDAWTIDGTFNTDYIVGRAITGFTFNNGNNTFKVDADGTVSAKKINIIGGSINIRTDSQRDDLIKLTNNEWSNSMAPLESVLTNSVDHTELKMQAGGIYLSLNSKVCAILANQGLFVKDANEKTRVIVSGNGIEVFDTDGVSRLTWIDTSGNIYAQHVWGQINS